MLVVHSRGGTYDARSNADGSSCDRDPQPGGGNHRIFLQILRALVPPKYDARETWRAFYKVGVQSYAIVIMTAMFTGAIMVIQAGGTIQASRATSFVGWAAGFTVLSEIGPVLIGLMFSGRVGANNTAELGTMVVTEQVDALRTLAIDPMNYLAVPRFIAMIVMLFLLVALGDLFALIGGAITSHFMWIFRIRFSYRKSSMRSY